VSVPFWSDAFDADLLKVVPGVEDLLGNAAEIQLWTYCRNRTHGRINLPTCWNTYHGMTSFFWTTIPPHHRDSYGWVRFGHGLTTNAQLTECTWLEVLRDEWVHGAIVNVDGSMVWRADLLQNTMMALMWDLRGPRKLPFNKRDDLRHRARRHIADATAGLCALLPNAAEVLAP
jgi:hypothetical protein